MTTMLTVQPWKVVLALLAFELLLNVAIIHRVPYTEIDWKAYMQEVEGVIQNGTLNYYDLKGDTGPLVYPAGFVWIYSALYWLTDNGTNILRAQYIFAAIYMVFIALVYAIYMESKTIPWWAFPILTLSKRIHSIFVLRLFNDCIAMTFLYGAILSFTSDFWTFGCLLFTVAVSVKMNVLLFAPGLAVLLCLRFGFLGSIPRIALCGIFQILVAVPFLVENPIAYLHRSFEFSRQFFQIWSVNLKFLPQDLFLSKKLAASLLLLHLVFLVVFLLTKWWSQNIFTVFRKHGQPSAAFIVSVLFSSNFIGVVFARSLHFQFYVWYYHSLPALLWICPFPDLIRVFMWIGIEIVWNIFPSNSYSSMALTTMHMIILQGLLVSKRWPFPYSRNRAAHSSTQDASSKQSASRTVSRERTPKKTKTK